MPAASWLPLSAYSAKRVMARFLFTTSIFTRLLQASRLLILFFFFLIMLKYGGQIQNLFKHVKQERRTAFLR